ncbi:MAG: hypothetical protein FWF24_00700 [Alphaproteobacteria bacterium]|nr:hypothetical protein [Alphaproteobacteria bacterium]
MKIAAKLSLTVLAVCVGFGLVQLAQAQNTAAPEAAPVAASTANEDSAAVRDALNAIDMPSAPAPLPPPPPKVEKPVSPAPSSKGIDLSDATEESSVVPASVKKIVDRLDNTTKEIMLEDLNAAREAIVKLDVLIDIEKRLTNLMDIRRDRDEAAAAAAPPPGRGMPPPPPPIFDMPMPVMPMPPIPQDMSFGRDPEIVRIVGAGGNYMAQMRDEGGAVKQLRVGDKLPNGSTVSSISRNGVTLTMSDKKTKTVQVQDVGTIFSNR